MSFNFVLGLLMHVNNQFANLLQDDTSVIRKIVHDLRESKTARPSAVLERITPTDSKMINQRGNCADALFLTTYNLQTTFSRHPPDCPDRHHRQEPPIYSLRMETKMTVNYSLYFSMLLYPIRRNDLRRRRFYFMKRPTSGSTRFANNSKPRDQEQPTQHIFLFY